MYKTCNCTLPYSNPDACKICSNRWEITYCTWIEFNDLNYLIKPIYTKEYNLKSYDPGTHELVEKKEAKTKRLNNLIENNKSTVLKLKEYIKITQKDIGDLEIENGKLFEELEALEK